MFFIAIFQNECYNDFIVIVVIVLRVGVCPLSNYVCHPYKKAGEGYGKKRAV